MNSIDASNQIDIDDQQARILALDPTQSYAVSAPAGSGKTELLIQRTLKLLAQVDKPENILAITFTRKAASEMRTRIITALEDAKLEMPLQSDHQQKTRALALAVLERDNLQKWQLLENPTRLRIQTIDAFSRQIANQLCLDTGFSLPPQMAEDPSDLYLRAAERMLDYLDTDSQIGASMRKLVAHVDGNLEEIAMLFAGLLGTRDSWLPLALSRELLNEDYLQERISALVDETLEQTVETISPYQSDLELLLNYALGSARENPDNTSWLDKNLEAHVPAADSSALAAWQALVPFLTTSSGKFRKSPDKRLGFPSEKESKNGQEASARKQDYKNLTVAMEEHPKLLALLDRIRILPNPEREAKTGQLNHALLQLLPTLAAELNVLSQELGETDYTAVAMAALRALGDPDSPTPLALRLDYRINHILVDEFQDTAHMQVRMLESLTAGWQPGDGRTLFIVGDGMQSIYSFRKANVSLFIRARQQGIGDVVLEPLDLTANFRSEAQVVNWVNQTFQALFPPEDDLVSGQVAFRAAQVIQPTSNYQIQLLGCASEEQEAQQIALDIAEKLNTTNDSLAILVRGRTHLRAILPALRSEHIQWQAQDIDPLSDRMAVMDVHSLTRALCAPADRIAWLSILRAPWAGLSNADLYQLCQWRPGISSGSSDDAEKTSFPPVWTAIQSAMTIETISGEGQQILERIKQVFTESFQYLGHMPLRNLVGNIWEQLHANSGLLDEQEQQDVADYLDLLEASEQSGFIQDWPKFESSLGRLYAKPSSGLNTEANKTTNVRLQIMTVHKSKGLEFDHVYIPALGKRQRANDNPLLLWWEREYEDGSDGYLLSTKPAKGEEDDLYAYLKTEHNAREKQELARLLYVACTRAKKSITLSAQLNYDAEKQQIKKPGSGSMLGLIWEQFEDDFSCGFLPDIESESDNTRSLNFIRRLDPTRPLSPPLKRSEATKTALTKTQPLQFSHNYLQRITGNILHDSLMKIVREKCSEPTPTMLLPLWEKQLGISGLSDQEKSSVIESLNQCIERMLEDKTGKWLLDTTHTESQAELELDYFDKKGGLQRAIVDRTFVFEGTRWIIDYKSSFPSKGETEEHFLERETATYRTQIQRYSQLFEANKEVRGMLYFPLIGRHSEIDI